jgi:hypothetical protein
MHWMKAVQSQDAHIFFLQKNEKKSFQNFSYAKIYCLEKANVFTFYL